MANVALLINAVKGLKGPQPFQVVPRKSLAVDPTQTIVLRQAFIMDINARYGALKGVIKESIVDNDCFGLKEKPKSVDEIRALSRLQEELNKLSPIKPNAFRFARSEKQAEGFMTWLKGQERFGVLEVTARADKAARGVSIWSDKYVLSSYQRGLARAKIDLKSLGVVTQPPIAPVPGGLSGTFHQAMHVDAVGLIFSRVYEELEGVTAAMNGQISRELAAGLSQGLGPYDIARNINNRVDKIGINRARLIARTEVVQSFNTAAINEFSLAEEITKTPVYAQWWSAGDSRVRPAHIEWHGEVFYREEALGMLGEPNCRCAVLPYIKGISVKGRDARVGGTSGARAVDVPRTSPASGKPPKNKPMASIGDKTGCLLPGMISNQLLFNKPKSCSDYVRDEKGNWLLKGKAVSDAQVETLNGMRLPPAWRNVVVSTNPKDKIQAIGMDKAGRWQYRYSAEHIQAAKMKKFNRVKSFSRDMPAIRRGMDEAVDAGDPRGMVLRLEDKTAIRAGSDTDFKAKKKAYGVTTLQHEHVTISGNTIKLDFIAKEGIRAQYTVKDEILAAFIKERKAATSVGERLWPDVSASKLNAFLKDLASGKKYTVKDFRTYHGTRIAHRELMKVKDPYNLSKKAKDELVKDVSKTVSDFLKNTPVMAKNSYINPMVWDIIDAKPKVVKPKVVKKPKAKPKATKPKAKLKKTVHYSDAEIKKINAIVMKEEGRNFNYAGDAAQYLIKKEYAVIGKVLTDDEAFDIYHSISDYTGRNYTKYRSVQMGKSPAGAASIRESVKRIKEYIDVSPDLPSGGVYFRGGGRASDLSALKKGDTFRFSRFLSYTTDETTALNFASSKSRNTVYRIQGKTAPKGTSISHVRADEAEVLMQANQEFTVVSKTWKKGRQGQNIKKYLEITLKVKE